MRLPYVKLNIQIQIGRWSVQFGNEHDRMRVILWKHHCSEFSSGSFARWQWDFRKRPVVTQESQVPVLEFAGARLVPMRLEKQETEDTWPEVIG